MSLCVGGLHDLTLELTLYPTTDYYYYATAGGAKIWVSSPHNYPCLRRIVILICTPMLPLSVEEVFDYYADRPVHRRPASCLLRE